MPATENPSPQDAPASAHVILPPPTVNSILDSTLPVGLRMPTGDRVRTVEFHEHTAEDLTVLRDTSIIRKSPITFMMRLIALGVEKIGGEAVYEEFKKSGFKQVPKLLEGLAITDAEYLIVAAHIHSYGGVTEGDWECPSCGEMQLARFDLTQMQVTKFPEGPEEHRPVVTVELERGITFDTIEAFPQFQQTEWKFYTMEMPTMSRLLQVEKVTGKRREKFDPKVLARSAVQISAGNGVVMPQDMKSMLGDDIILKLKARDMISLGKFVFDYLPRLDRELRVTCENCGVEAGEGLDPTMLLPGG